MTAKTRPTAPTYLTWDAARNAWQLRFRYVDSLGRVHWPRERSPHPRDYQASARWAPIRRAELVAEIEAELRRLDPAPPLSLGEVLDAYEADCLERGTRWEREQSRARILRETLGDQTPVAAITVAGAMEWRTRLRLERSLSSRSLNAYTNLLAAALNLAVRRGQLAQNPLRALRKLPQVDREPPALSEHQVGALLAACRVWWRWERMPKADRRRRLVPVASRALAGYYTGARPEAVDRMEWQQLDLRRGTWRYDSKGHRAIVCPLEPSLLEHLRSLHEAAGRPASGPVWLSPRSRRRVIDWRKPLRRLVALANHRLQPGEQISAATPLHHLRHSRISHLLGAGVPAQVVAQVTGTSLAMLQRHYAHLMVATLQGELARARQHPVLAAIESFAHGQTAQAKRDQDARRTGPSPNSEPASGEVVN